MNPADLENMRFLASKHDGDPHISRVPSSYLTEAAAEIERLAARVSELEMIIANHRLRGCMISAFEQQARQSEKS